MNPDKGLVNATIYLDAFGRMTVSRLWLKQGTIAARALSENPSGSDAGFYQGKLQASHYYVE